MTISNEDFEFLKKELLIVQKEIRYLKEQNLLPSIKNYLFDEVKKLMNELDSIDSKDNYLEYEKKFAQVTIANDLLRGVLNIEAKTLLKAE